jgi:hypothetical protein
VKLENIQQNVFRAAQLVVAFGEKINPDEIALVG